MNAPELTDKERDCLEHLKRADELGVSLKEYAAAYELDVQMLYKGKRQLTKKGALDESGSEAMGDFVAVQLANPPASPICQLRHASGWELDCHEWPSPAWLCALVGGSFDAS